MKININNFVIKKPTKPQPGNVSTQVSTISLTTPKLIAETRFTAPTPIIDVVLACVVDTGRLNTEQIKSEIAAAISAEKP